VPKSLLNKKTASQRFFYACATFEVPSGLPPALRASGDPVKGGDPTKRIISKTSRALPGRFYLPLRGPRASSRPLRRKQKTAPLGRFLEVILFEVPSGFEPL
jgi:hypothetical protein